MDKKEMVLVTVSVSVASFCTGLGQHHLKRCMEDIPGTAIEQWDRENGKNEPSVSPIFSSVCTPASFWRIR